MKIVIATAVYHPMTNGVATFSHNLAVGLKRRGHEVLVLCPSQSGRSYTRTVEGVKVCYLKSVQVKVYPDQIHDVPEPKRFLGMALPQLYKHGFRISVFPARKIAKLLDKFQPDVIHVQVSDPIGLSTVSYARSRGVPVVTTEHNRPDVFTGSLKLPKPIKKPVDALLAAYFANRQSKSDFVTMPTEEAIKELLKSQKQPFAVPIAAVSNGVDLGSFKPGRASKALYEKYGLEFGKPTILHVGRLDPEKNVSAVIKAFRELVGGAEKDERDGAVASGAGTLDAQLVIVGDGVDKPNLMKKAGGDPRIHFLGKITPPELYKVYHLGDLFTTASEIETEGVVLLEAAASGLPLVAVDDGPVREICVDGENGILCKSGDAKGMAAAFYQVLTDRELREKFAKASPEIAKKHDFETTLDKFINIYNHVISDKTL